MSAKLQLESGKKYSDLSPQDQETHDAWIQQAISGGKYQFLEPLKILIRLIKDNRLTEQKEMMEVKEAIYGGQYEEEKVAVFLFLKEGKIFGQFLIFFPDRRAYPSFLGEVPFPSS